MGKEGDLFGIDKLRLWIPEWKCVCFRHCDPRLKQMCREAAQVGRTDPTAHSWSEVLEIVKGSRDKGAASCAFTVLQAGYALVFAGFSPPELGQALLTLFPGWFLLEE